MTNQEKKVTEILERLLTTDGRVKFLTTELIVSYMVTIEVRSGDYEHSISIHIDEVEKNPKAIIDRLAEDMQNANYKENSK
jgi:hypothetical protein